MKTSVISRSGNRFLDPIRHLPRFGCTVLAAVFLAPDVRAGGTVTPCNQANLQAALAGGGLVTFNCSGTIVVTNTLVIEQDTVLDGSGHSVTISGNNAVRPFEVRPGVVFTVMGLTIANGRIVGTNGVGAIPGETVFGGAIYCDGATLNLVNCVVSNNAAVGGNGSPFSLSNPISDAGHAFGGAIYCRGGSLSISDSVMANNWARGGSLPAGALDTFHNRVGNAFGGGISLDATAALLTRTRVWANVASNGITEQSSNSVDTDGDASGGGIYTLGGTVRVEQSSFSANLCVARAFAPRSTTAGRAAGGGVYVQSGALHLSATSFENNQVSGGGIRYINGTAGEGAGGGVFNGGLFNATNCLFRANSAQGGVGSSQAADGCGGAVCNTGVLVVVACNISTNAALGGRGFSAALGAEIRPAGNGRGGGILNNGRFLLLDTTLSDNRAKGGEGDPYSFRQGRGADGLGGAVWNAGMLCATNNTIASSAAVGGDGGSPPGSPNIVGGGGSGLGGGFYNAGGTSWLAHATIAGNSAQAGFGPKNVSNAIPGVAVGGGINVATGTVELVNCIVAGSPSGSNCWGQITDLGHNLSSDLSCSFTNAGLTGVDPRLGPLANYGGPTPTFPLVAGSPAIDAADGASCPSVDQRGHARPFGAGCDIGAFESSPPYTVRGAVRGPGNGAGISVTAGSTSTVTDSNGNYALDGLAGGNYTVGPSSPLFVFMPASSAVTLGPDIIGLDFDAYRSNGLVMQKWTMNLVRGVMAGAAGDVWEIQRSSQLPSWLPFATNSLPASGVWEFFDASEPGSRFYRGVRH